MPPPPSYDLWMCQKSPARLKMGVCEGSPRSIFPDHNGRADYHGASINQAARFMDAGELYELFPPLGDRGDTESDEVTDPYL